MALYEFWTHGVNVQIEYPDNIVGMTGDECAEPRRSGWGTSYNAFVKHKV